MVNRKYDIIIWGATGFTGTLIAEYLSTTKTATKFAIAGRSLNKLNALAQNLIKLPSSRFNLQDIIVADSNDPKLLREMALQGTCIITTVGPYAKYGFPLVEACVENRTHYLDITGEPLFIKEVVNRYHALAQERGVMIIHSCGFDSIPSDIGSFLIANHFKGLNLKTDMAKGTLSKADGSLSGGTIDTLINMVSTTSWRDLHAMNSNPDFLSSDVATKGAWNGLGLHFDKVFKKWQAKFVMEATNMRLVRRSSHLLGYGKYFQYGETVSAPNVFVAALINSFLTIGVLLLLLIPPLRWVVSRVMPPGTGPTLEQRKNGFFVFDMYGQATTQEGKIVTAKVNIQGKGDPGYDATSRMISECAISLVQDTKKRSTTAGGNFQLKTGGVLTPASALGLPVVDRLNASHIVFKVDTKTEGLPQILSEK